MAFGSGGGGRGWASEKEGEIGKQGGEGDHQPTPMSVEQDSLVTRKEENISLGGGGSSGATDVGSMGETTGGK